jgi:hypothetical protein
MENFPFARVDMEGNFIFILLGCEFALAPGRSLEVSDFIPIVEVVLKQTRAIGCDAGSRV